MTGGGRLSSDQRSRIETAVGTSLTRVIDPELRRPITELDMIGVVTVDEAGAASVELKLTIVGLSLIHI